MILAAVLATVVAAGDIMPPEPERSRQIQEVLTLDDAAMDAAFQCPNGLPKPEDELWRIALYLYWAKHIHPDWTRDQAVEFRHQMFIRHKCTPWSPSSMN